MDNQDLQKIGNTGGIGFNKYKFLKSLPYEDLTDEEKEQIKEFEVRFNPSPEQLEFKKKYIERLVTEPEQVEFEIKKAWLWKKFLENYKVLKGLDFVQNSDTLENIKTIMLYFLKDPEFFNCKNLCKLSKPSFEKGLIIIGAYGNGKTSTMQAIEKTLSGIKGYSFKSYNANEVVKMFESINIDNYTIDLSRKDFDLKMLRGDRFFDDVKTEKDASNFGKFNLFKDILETRCGNGFKTYVTCNYDPNYPNDLEKGIDEFGFRYGERVYDRIFEMFNIIEFKGKSFRL